VPHGATGRGHGRGGPPLRGGPPRGGCDGHLFPGPPAMTRRRFRAGAVALLLAAQVCLGSPAVATAVDRPEITGPVPEGGQLHDGPLRTDGPCRTTAAVLDPAAPPASATAA